MKGLKTRAISAVVFIAIMIAGIYGGAIPMKILLTMICLLCLWEYFDLVFDKIEKKTLRKIIGTIIGLIVFATFYLEQNQFLNEIELPITLIIVFLPSALLFIFELYQKDKHPFENIGKTILGVTYIALPISLLMSALFENNQYRPNLLLGIFILIWSNDTFAYLVGSKIGKNKLFPRISPGKTWEGTIGGGICTLIIAFLIFRIFGELELTDWIIFGGIVTTFGTIGDLVESMLKRSKNVKDSGNIMPGHGGALDRFDAFIFVLPFIGLYLFMI